MVNTLNKPEFEAVVTETSYVISDLKHTIKNLSRWAKPKKVFPFIVNIPSSDYIYKEPYGKVLIISPWNYPFHNVFNPVSAALFSGNAIVLKVSEYASWSISYYKRIIDACLESVGAPKDLVQYVVGYRTTGEALVKSKIDKMI